MYACLGISGNVDNFIELLKLLQRKLLEMSVFSFKPFNGISELCDTLFTFSFQFAFDQPQ